MTRYLKSVGALIVAFAIIGVAMTLFGLPHSTIAATNRSSVSISPEELTRSAGPMPVQLIENYQ